MAAIAIIVGSVLGLALGGLSLTFGATLASALMIYVIVTLGLTTMALFPALRRSAQ